MKALKWDLAPLTITAWLNVYLQVANIDNIVEAEHGFVFPQYSSHAFVQIARVSIKVSVQFNAFVISKTWLYIMYFYVGFFHLVYLIWHVYYNSWQTCVYWTLAVWNIPIVSWQLPPSTTLPQKKWCFLWQVNENLLLTDLINLLIVVLIKIIQMNNTSEK